MRTRRWFLSGALALPLAALTLPGCGSGSGGGADERTFNFDFNEGIQGWTHGFADYPVGNDANFEFVFDASISLPESVDANRRGVRIGGANRSDDLFMFLKRKVEGLDPNRTYSVRFEVALASNERNGTPGAGGSPAQAVTVKAGATTGEPARIEVEEAGRGVWRMNIDKGNQGMGGRDALVLGDIGVDTGGAYLPKELTSGPTAFTVRADSNGAAWLIVGTDSGYEGTTILYYTGIKAVFTPL